MIIGLVVTVHDKCGCGCAIADRAFCNHEEASRYADKWRVLGKNVRFDVIPGAMPGTGHGEELPEPEVVPDYW